MEKLARQHAILMSPMSGVLSAVDTRSRLHCYGRPREAACCGALSPPPCLMSPPAPFLPRLREQQSAIRLCRWSTGRQAWPRCAKLWMHSPEISSFCPISRCFARWPATRTRLANMGAAEKGKRARDSLETERPKRIFTSDERGMVRACWPHGDDSRPPRDPLAWDFVY
jgi:hypothetical protein